MFSGQQVFLAQVVVFQDVTFLQCLMKVLSFHTPDCGRMIQPLFQF